MAMKCFSICFVNPAQNNTPINEIGFLRLQKFLLIILRTVRIFLTHEGMCLNRLLSLQGRDRHRDEQEGLGFGVSGLGQPLAKQDGSQTAIDDRKRESFRHMKECAWSPENLQMPKEPPN